MNAAGPVRRRSPASPGSWRAEHESRRGTPALLARFDSSARARAAIERLESLGVDGDSIELLGPAVDRPRAATRHREGVLARGDARLLRYVTTHVGRGSALGAVLGAVAGAVVGLVVIVSVNGIGAPGLLVVGCALGGALLGGVTGAFVAVERSTGFSESWPLTFAQPDGGAVWLALYDHSDRARRGLVQCGPSELRRPTDLDSLARLFRGVE